MENQLSSCSALRRRRRIGKKSEPSLSIESFLVDDIIIGILSWLPAKDVLRCRCVCRTWRDLTSTIDFTNLHIRRSFPMILKDHNYTRNLLDRWWEPARTRSKIHKFSTRSQRSIQFSQNGLIVAGDAVRNDGDFDIFNPTNRDMVSISVPVKPFPCRSEMYGVFFHPVQKEYCTLWRTTLSLQPWKVQYKILNLESNPHWREIKNPCSQNAMILDIRLVLIDKYLYWMVEPSQHYRESLCFANLTFIGEIMEYDIINEEFRVIPCPVLVKTNGFECNVNLLDIYGVVSLVQVLASKELIEIVIWTLKDNREQLWTSSHHIVSPDVYLGDGVPKAVACRSGELVLQSDGRLCVCNLKLGTFRKFGRQHKDFVKILSHVTSLASLRNCKSKICMVEEDEKNSKR